MVSGVRVTTVSEAFARFQFKNYREKWRNTFAYKKVHGSSAPLPLKKTDVGYEKFKALYSDNTIGQVKGAGWSHDAFSQFNKYIIDIHDFRKEDKKKDWRKHRLALSLIQGKYEIDVSVTPKKKKRKTDATVVTPITPREDIIQIRE